MQPLRFDDPGELARSMSGAHTVYNTYWVRFAHGGVDHEQAVVNSRILFEAAATAGVERIVHISIMRPSLDSPYPYFRGKAQVEQILAGTGLSYAIVRPAILFGGNDVLVNNLAWLLRHVPVFAVGGRGEYRIRGIHVSDLAKLCVRLGGSDDVTVTDAVGPESLRFRRFVEVIRAAVGSLAVVIPVPVPVLVSLSTALGILLGDRLLTAEEHHAMADGLADSDAQATGTVRFSDWAAEHGDELGRKYANEIDRHFRQPEGDLRRDGQGS